MGLRLRSIVAPAAAAVLAGGGLLAVNLGRTPPARAATALSFSHGVVVDEQRPGFEPDIRSATDSGGTIYSSMPFGFSTTQSFLWSSLDHGNSFQLTPGNIGSGKPTTCAGGGDTDLFLDPANNLYFSDLQGLTNISQSVTSDGGKTFSTNCAGVPNTPVDRMWFTGTGTLNGTGAGALNLYEDYDAANGVTTGLGNQLVETVSHDGLTFGPVVNSAPPSDCVGPAVANCVTGNEGISGNQVIDPTSGALYIAHTTTNGTGSEVGVALSEGAVTTSPTGTTATWTESPNLDAALCPNPTCVDPSGNPEEISGQNFSVVARDSAGFLYVVYAAAPLDHASTSDANFGGDTAPTAVYVVHSLEPTQQAKPSNPNGGTLTFSAPQKLSTGGTDVFPWIVAGDNGRVDIAWYHTDETSETGPCINTTSAQCTLFGAASLNHAEWSVELAQSLDANSTLTQPSYQVAPVSEHPIKFGPICTSGLSCTTGGDRSLGDFLQVGIDSQGAALVSYVDDTSADNAGGEDAGPEEVSHQIGGSSLLNAVGSINGPGAGPGVPLDSVTDPTGDAAYSANGSRTAGGDNLDLTGASISDAANGNLNVTMNVKSLASLTASPAVGGPDASYILRWTSVTPGVTGNGHIYYAGMDTNSGGTPTFFDGDTSCLPATGQSAEHCKALTYPQTHVLLPTQASYNAATGLVTIQVPKADVGSPAVGTTLYSATAFSATSLTPQSATTVFNLIDATTPFDHTVGAATGGTGSTTSTNPGGGTTTTTAPGSTTSTTAAGSHSQPTSARLSGSDRIGTAVAVSHAVFPTSDSAATVTLARSDLYPDALAGGPFALAQGGPLLLTETGQLDSATRAEIQRVLPAGGRVYLLGGTGALSDAVAQAVTAAGYKPIRVSGANRYATAVAIANALSPSSVLEASGLNFPDALAAGPAASVDHGAVLLTDGSSQAPETAAYLRAHGSDVRYAVGGPAASADPGATALVGADRYATSAAVAGRFFGAPATVGIATGLDFPDASTSAPLLGFQGGPLLLVQPTGDLPGSVASYLSGHSGTISTIEVFGGTRAVSDQVEAEAVSTG